MLLFVPLKRKQIITRFFLNINIFVRHAHFFNTTLQKKSRNWKKGTDTPGLRCGYAKIVEFNEKLKLKYIWDMRRSNINIK